MNDMALIEKKTVEKVYSALLNSNRKGIVLHCSNLERVESILALIKVYFGSEVAYKESPYCKEYHYLTLL